MSYRLRFWTPIALLPLLAACGGSVETGAIRADPDQAAAKAAGIGDWRLAVTRVPEGQAIEGVRCSLPLERWSFVTRYMSVPVATDVAQPNYVEPPDSAETRSAAARFNARLVGDPDSPYRALCIAGGATVRTANTTLLVEARGTRPMQDWAVLRPLSPQPTLLAAARAGQSARTAVLPLDDAFEEDFLGLNVLSWAVVRRDRALLARLAGDEGARADFCRRERRDVRQREQERLRTLHPLGLAVDQGDAAAAQLVIGMVSVLSCPDGEDGHAVEQLFRDALSRAQTKRDQSMMVALVRGYYAGARSDRTATTYGRLATGFLEAGLEDAAVATAAMIPETRATYHPLGLAARSCDLGKFRFWLGRLDRSRSRAFLANAMTSVEHTLPIWRPGEDPARGDCLALFETLIDQGQHVARDSGMLAAAIESDRIGGKAPFDEATATRIASAFVRAGGDLRVDRSQAPDQREDNRSPARPCTVFALSEGPPPSHCRTAIRADSRPSIFARVLGRLWPAERAASERAFEQREAAARGSLSPLCRIPNGPMAARVTVFHECRRRFGRTFRIRTG